LQGLGLKAASSYYLISIPMYSKWLWASNLPIYQSWLDFW